MADKTTLTGEPTEVNASVRYWLGEIAYAKKREKDFRKEGDRIIEIYNAKRNNTVPFNILYSNTETLSPALYGSVPRPVVQRRFKDEDPIGKLSAQAGTRGLEYFMDTNMEDYQPFDQVMQDAVLDALLPGRGVSRLKYEPVMTGVETPVKTYEAVCPESIVWNRVTFGYAKKWCKVPWIAFEHHMTKDQAAKVFKPAVVAKMTFTTEKESDNDDKFEKSISANTDEVSDLKVCIVQEIWDRAGGKKVKFISSAYKEGYLQQDDDPLGLTGFFPVPEPLRLLKKSNDQVPTALFLLYENQAKELNVITTRLNKLIAALKVRGAYDSTITELENVLKSEDNTLIPADNVAALQDKNGLENAIWLMPIDKLITVIQQLFTARQQCKQVIYEVTGISDILRGQSVASETATAQEIKNQWGTLRLKRMQKDVQRYARDMLRITLEIMGKHFSEQTFAAMTGMKQIISTEKKEEAKKLMQIGMQAEQQGIQVPPQVKQQVMQTAAAPSWGEVLALLRDDQQRAYRIDIETNSTVDLEATEDQKNMTEAMTAIGQVLASLTPLVVAGSLPFESAQAMLLTVARRFRFGPEVEDYISAMKAPKPPDDGKAAAAQEAMAKNKLETDRLMFESNKAKAEFQQTQQADAMKHQREVESEKGKMASEAARLQMEQTVKLAEIAANRDMELAKIRSQRDAEREKMQMQQATELKKAEIQAATQLQIAQIGAQSQKETSDKESAGKDGENKALVAITEALTALTAPKEVVRDSSGKVVSIVQKKAVKA